MGLRRGRFQLPLGRKAIVGDTNPHVADFYNEVKDGVVSGRSMRRYLEREGRLLETAGEDGYFHFREVRDRFNAEASPFDFVFLSRTGFNGIIKLTESPRLFAQRTGSSAIRPLPVPFRWQGRVTSYIATRRTLGGMSITTMGGRKTTRWHCARPSAELRQSSSCRRGITMNIERMKRLGVYGLVSMWRQGSISTTAAPILRIGTR